MAGLNDLVTNKDISTTTLPSWYSTAQQNLVNQATGVNAPAIGDTAAQSAVSAFGAGSPFTSGQNILQSIGSGAANPWLVTTDATGAQTVKPNVATSLGGLFQAQSDYLGDILPDIQAEETAKAISGGGFGGRMNISGLARETGKAYSDLAQKQMQAALQAQQTGVAAGAGLGNLGQDLVQSAINTGTFQQNAPYAGSTNLANILGKVDPGKATTTSRELGGLNQIMGLLSAAGGATSVLQGKYTVDRNGNIVKVPGLLDQLGIKGGLAGLFPGATGNVNVEGTTPPANWEQISGGTYDPESGMIWYQGADDQGYAIDAGGNYYDAGGDLIWSPSWEYEDTGGSDTDNWDLF